MSHADNTSPYDASEYAKGIRATVPHYDAFHSEIIALVKALKPDVQVWLDTGCGDGALIEKAVAQLPRTQFLLADPAPTMLSEAMKRLSDVPPARLTVIGTVGTQDLPYDSEFRPEVITAVMSHHYFDREQRREATKRCFDLLADGGIYITFESIHPGTEYGLEAGFKRWIQFQVSRGRDAGAAGEHTRRFNKSYFPITANEHLSLMTECGFRPGEMFWLSYMQGGFYAVKPSAT
jgi:tRNA (cmo5U34)-methyltransferase